MTHLELAALAFGACNAVRILAYVPQIACILRDRGDAAAVSCLSWALFAVSHLTTMIYAVAVLGDHLMALMFAGNSLACAAIVGLTAAKRRRHRALLAA
ncbi:hypothetical protein [Salinarimonas sp.]|uniref:hypothetical protein n=1 Tax=Salinarimonas sp. TaxID=2766526 RepID=UPI003918E703